MLGVSYETAWHLGHRIRAMMAEDSPLMSNVVEIDEVYAGTLPRKRAKPEREEDDGAPPPTPKGRGTKRPLVLVAERGGDVVAKVIPPHSKEAIASVLDGVLDPEATVMTDGLPAYKHIGKRQTHLSVSRPPKPELGARPITASKS